MWTRQPSYRIDENIDWDDPVLKETREMESPGGSGQDNWRVPNVFELASLIDFTKAQGPVFADVFDLDPEEALHLWTSTTRVSDQQRSGSEYAWFIPFSHADPSYQAGCIRAAPDGRKWPNAKGCLAVRGFSDD